MTGPQMLFCGAAGCIFRGISGRCQVCLPFQVVCLLAYSWRIRTRWTGVVFCESEVDVD